MKVLVTGGAGFIGSHVVDVLADANHDVTIVDNLSSGKRENIAHALGKKIKFVLCDIVNVLDLTSVFLEHKPEVVIHLAAQPSIGRSIDCPTEDLEINGIGTLHVIQAAARVETRRIVLASTSAVYPSDARICAEALTPRPDSPYGVSKMVAEHYLRLSKSATVLRLGNVYGPRQVPLGENQVIPKMIRHRLFGDPFFIHGDGRQMRDYVYVRDVADAFARSMNQDGFSVYNIATGRRQSVNNLAEILNFLLESPYDWPHDTLQDPRRNVNLDVHDAALFLRWVHSTAIVDGMRKTLKWWKEQK